MKLTQLIGLEKRHATNVTVEPAAPLLRIPPRAATGYKGLPAVYRAVTVLQTAAQQLSLDAWKNGIQLTGENTPTALARPWDYDTQRDLIADLMGSLTLTGNAYALAVRDKYGVLTGIRVLHPEECAPEHDKKTGLKWVAYDGKKYRANELAHARLLRLPGYEKGLSPISFARKTLERAHKIADAGAHIFERGGVPTGILTTEQPISAETAKAAKNSWNESNSTLNGVAVLGEGITYKPVTISPADAQFLESQKYSDAQIAMLFGVPPHLMGIALDGSSMTYQNLQDGNTSFMQWTVSLYLSEIENALSKLLPRGTITRFNYDAVLRPDAKKRMETHTLAINAGIYTPQYAALEIEGLPAHALTKTGEHQQ